MLGTHDDPRQRHYLNLYKLGEGPLYCFYTPYHLCHFEVPNTVARAALFGDAALDAAGRARVEVVATAKRDLHGRRRCRRARRLHTYGEAENADVTARERLLPMGVAEGCTLMRDVAEGRGPHLRRRRPAAGPAGRPAPRRAGQALRLTHARSTAPG